MSKVQRVRTPAPAFKVLTHSGGEMQVKGLSAGVAQGWGSEGRGRLR